MITIDELINALGDHRAGVRALAIRRFKAMGARAIPILITQLVNPDDDVVDGVCAALKHIGKPAVECLNHAMQSDDRKLQWASAWVLSQMMEPDVQPEPRTMASGSARVRQAIHGQAFHEWVLQPAESQAMQTAQ